tara:strand:+ start:501 stop:602 length:102 start_codon:yes stop_codon:yes gene_type:complete
METFGIMGLDEEADKIISNYKKELKKYEDKKLN